MADRFRRTDDGYPAIPGKPYSYPLSRIPERDITPADVHQHIGPLIKILVSQTADTGTVTVVLNDVAHTVLTSNPVEFSVGGTLFPPTTHPIVGVNGNYTYTFTLDPKHNIVVMPIVHQNAPLDDIRLGGETFDVDANADVQLITVTINGNTATVHVQFDSDTATGSTKAEYSFDNGTTWTAFAVASDKTGSFTKTLTGSDQPFLVRGKNASNVAGPAKASNVPSSGISLVTMVQIDSTEVIITWAGTNVTLSVDGAPFGPVPPDDDPLQGGNQLTIARDSSDHTYVFQSAVNGQSTSTSVHVPALGGGTGPNGEFHSLTNTLHDVSDDTVDFGWTWDGDPSAQFNIYVSDGGGAYGLIDTTLSGATTYRYTSTHDLTSSITPTVDIGFYVEAVVGSTILGARSVPLMRTYGTV